jgi:hypothetical protein
MLTGEAFDLLQYIQKKEAERVMPFRQNNDVGSAAA